MPVEALPLWTLLPNWRETVSERLEWLSPVLVSPTGAEQRYALRTTPRRSLEATYSVSGRDRAWLDHALQAAGAARWYAPVKPDLGRTTADIVGPSSAVPVATAGREFRVGSFVMLHRDLFTASVHEITAVGPSSLTVAPDVAGTWPAGTLAIPADVVRVPDLPSLNRLGDRTAEARIRFDVDGPSPFAAASLGTLYAGYPVLTTPPNETGDLTTQYNRLLAEFSTRTARRFIVDVAAKNFSVQQHRWFLAGRAERDALRGYFHALEGRRVATWVPTFSADFDVLNTISSGATTITVLRCGYAAFGGPRFGREHIRIETRSGTAYMRRITGAAEAGDTEVLTIDSALGATVTPADIRRVSFMDLMRLDQDGIEFVHYADKLGAMTASAAFRTAGEFRTPTAFTPLPFPFATMTAGACGTPPDDPEPILLGDFYIFGNYMADQALSVGQVVFNAFTTDPTNSTGLPGGAATAAIVAPAGTVTLRVSGQVLLRQLNGSAAGERVVYLEKQEATGDPWIVLASASIGLASCSLTECGPYAVAIPEQTVAFSPGWKLRVRVTGTSGILIRYLNDPDNTFLEGSWIGLA